MIWLTWRQFRTQAAIALGALVIVAIVLALTGSHVTHLYDTTVVSCTAHNDCSRARSTFVRYDLLLQNGLNAFIIFVPVLIGMFWGAPLVAREFETGTFRLAWTEGVTRRAWLVTKLAVVGLASMVVAGLLSFMVTWWSSRIDQVNMNRLSPGIFAARDIAPIGYAAFA
ncbi:MAG: ABC transporter permease subunit, partial [Acidimicrobiales bacterium]